MFILGNIVAILLFSVFLFAFFTFLNINTFARGVFTSLFLTFIFFDLFFRMPFKAVISTYDERDKIIQAIRKDRKLNQEQKEKMEFILQKRSRTFIALYRAGQFSYTEQMLNLTDWYKNKPFKIKVKVKVSIFKQRKKTFEKKYIKEIEKDITGLCTS